MTGLTGRRREAATTLVNLSIQVYYYAPLRKL